MTIYDPPADPYGDERGCSICDGELTYNYLPREWECLACNLDISPDDNKCPKCAYSNMKGAPGCEKCETPLDNGGRIEKG